MPSTTAKTKRRNRALIILLGLALLVGLVIGASRLAQARRRSLAFAQAVAAVMTPGPTPSSSPTPIAILDAAHVSALFDARQAMEHVEALTGPELAGRAAGSPGGAAAALYVARQFAALGLEPVGAEGYDGYFQNFDVPYVEITSLPTLDATRADGSALPPLVYGSDYRESLGRFTGTGDIEGAVLWADAGNALDYAQADMRGKIVLCSADSAEDAAREAMAHEAAGVLVVANDESNVTSRRAYDGTPDSKRLPALWLTAAAANKLLDGTGFSLDDLLALGKSQPLPIQAHFVVQANETRQATGRNVLGLLRGSRATKRNQVVIIGAHYDGLGMDPDGTVYAGANEDASGVATMLEILRSWRMAGYRPAYSVLFAAWDGEELEQLGSTEFIHAPGVAWKEIVAEIQLDMVGVAPKGVLGIDAGIQMPGLRPPDRGDMLVGLLQEGATLYGVDAQVLEWETSGDHVTFLQARMSAALLTWDGADVPYIHTPEDTLATVQPELLGKVGAVASYAAVAITTP